MIVSLRTPWRALPSSIQLRLGVVRARAHAARRPHRCRAPALTPAQVRGHGQVDANGYLPEVVAHDGSTFRLPASPMQFGGVSPVPGGPAPELGQHTEEILLELGHDWDAISELRHSGTLG